MKIEDFPQKMYVTPSEYALRHRKKFYTTTKLVDESITEWFKRTEENISGCEFGELINFMLIDKFISGLNDEVFENFALQSTLTAEQALSIALTFDLCLKTEVETKIEPTYSSDGFLHVELINNEEPNQQLSEDDLYKQTSANDNDEDYSTDVSEGNKNDQASREENIFVRTAEQSKNKQTRSDECVKATESRPQVDSKSVVLGFKIDEQKRIVCLDCSKSFGIMGSYKIHRRIHTGEDLHGCNICGRLYTVRSKLKQHKLMHTNDGKTFECYLCSLTFNYLHTLKTHLTLKHVASKKDKLQCTYCEKKYFSAKTFQIHLRVHQGKRKSFKCHSCDRVFDRRNRMLLHAAVHSDLRPFTCEKCGKSFKTKRHLSNHIRRHADEGPFKCPECSKTLKSRHTYNNHMSAHANANKRSYKCTLCEKTFAKQPVLMRHLRFHRNERPNGCTLCDKRFPTPYHLRLHMSVHTGEKPYKCNFCEKAYTQPTTLRLHQEKYHVVPTKVAPMPMY